MTRFIRPLLAVALLSRMAGATASVGNVSYVQTHWDNSRVHVVYINLNSPDLKVTAAISKRGPGSAESFRSMLDRTCPTAAITGTFFCTRSLQPTGDIVIDGKLVNTGSIGTAVCFTYGNRVEFMPLKQLRRSGWNGYETVLCAGPTLLRGGAIALAPRAEGFGDPGIYAKRRRAALGVTKNNKLMLVTVEKPMYLRTLAKVMLHLGAREAVDLDGGSSAALYYKGRVISKPGRKLTNLLVTYDSLESYLKHRHALAPGLDTPVAGAKTSALRPLSTTSETPASIRAELPSATSERMTRSGRLSWLTAGRGGHFITTRQ